MDLDYELITENINIEAEVAICKPNELKASFPRSEKSIKTVHTGQTYFKNICDGREDRLVVIVGPCSIHDVEAAREYAAKLKALAEKLSDVLVIYMRVYFEKPRTNVGWKGLLNDPDLDNSCKIEKGLEMGRSLMLSVTEMGVPIAAEALDVLTPQYIQDLVSWTAIGARTTESPCHRQMASGFSSAVGFKNGTDGDLDVAVNAIRSACQPSSFLTCSVEGRVCVVETKGNAYTHIVLRGGKSGPNYEEEDIKDCETRLRGAGLPENILVDCSHGNSLKDHKKQKLVVESLLKQIENGNRSIIGMMIESYIHEGNQKLPTCSNPKQQLKYGVSITDACIGWEETEELLSSAAERLRSVLPGRRTSNNVTPAQP